MDSLNRNMTEMIQQSALSIAKQTKKQKNPKISSPTRALMKKRREMIENKTPRDHIEYVEICKTIKKKEKCREYNIPLRVAFVDYIRFSTHPINIDNFARTRNRRCIHRNPERHI